MRYPEGYCWWCGTWKELSLQNAICRECGEAHSRRTSKQ
jgi:hypothetical protein